MNNYELDTDMLSLLPPWYREILDYQEICKTEKEQFDALAAEITTVADNFFTQTMDTGAVSQWEQIFKITPDPATETLEFRRARIQNRLSTRPPFTLGFLYQKLDELIGPNKWTVRVDYANYTLYIESSAEDQSYASEVAYTLNSIKPAHIVYYNSPYVQNGLLLSETIEFSKNVYNYRLGAWGLGILPFASETEHEVIKMASTPSITEALLADTADFISSDVASARINGTISITNITKAVDGNVLSVTYSVSPSMTSAITKIELLDASGVVLTESTLYVPVADTIVMKHKIPVAEGVLNSGN